MSNAKPMTWAEILGQVHPEWPNASDKTKRRIKNKAWAYGFHVDDNGVVGRGCENDGYEL